MSLAIGGPPNAFVTLETSTDLVNWEPLAVLFNSTGAVQVADAYDPALPSRYYRASQSFTARDGGLAFFGDAPGVSGSEGHLLLRPGLAQPEFLWSSNDQILGPVETSFTLATDWQSPLPEVGPCAPRLMFHGEKSGARFSGYVVFAPSPEAVVEVTRIVDGVARVVRYFLEGLTVDVTLYKSDQKTKLPEDRESVPGGWLPVDNDDDNRNGKKDKEDDKGENGEDDMLKFTLEITLPPKLANKGLVYLRKVNSDDGENSKRVKIWKDPQKGGANLVLDVNQKEKVWDLSAAAERNEFNGLRNDLWIEGVAGSAALRDVRLELAYQRSGHRPLRPHLGHDPAQHHCASAAERRRVGC